MRTGCFRNLPIIFSILSLQCNVVWGNIGRTHVGEVVMLFFTVYCIPRQDLAKASVYVCGLETMAP
jgi:hypothetical protein